MTGVQPNPHFLDASFYHRHETACIRALLTTLALGCLAGCVVMAIIADNNAYYEKYWHINPYSGIGRWMGYWTYTDLGVGCIVGSFFSGVAFSLVTLGALCYIAPDPEKATYPKDLNRTDAEKVCALLNALEGPQKKITDIYELRQLLLQDVQGNWHTKRIANLGPWVREGILAEKDIYLVDEMIKDALPQKDFELLLSWRTLFKNAPPNPEGNSEFPTKEYFLALQKRRMWEARVAVATIVSNKGEKKTIEELQQTLENDRDPFSGLMLSAIDELKRLKTFKEWESRQIALFSKKPEQNVSF